MKYITTIIIAILSLTMTACGGEKTNNKADKIQFITSAVYPPFEYLDNNQLKGYDIDLAQLIAQKLGKKAEFSNVQFSSILPSLNAKQADVAISTITITAERKKNFDLTEPYYFDGMASVFPKAQPIQNPQEIKGKKIAVQIGTTMEIWLKKKAEPLEIISMDNNTQAITALKTGLVDAVLMDGAQAVVFSKINPGLSFAMIAQADDGYGLALTKNNPLTQHINQALQQLQQEGELTKLKQKWLENTEWKK